MQHFTDGINLLPINVPSCFRIVLPGRTHICDIVMVTRTAMGASQWASSIFPVLDQLLTIFNTNNATEMWQKPSSARRAWQKTAAKGQRKAKNQPRIAARRDVFSTTSYVMEEPKKTEMNEFEIETHQVALESDFSDWDVDVLRGPDDDGPNWRLDKINIDQHLRVKEAQKMPQGCRQWTH